MEYLKNIYMKKIYVEGWFVACLVFVFIVAKRSLLYKINLATLKDKLKINNLQLWQKETFHTTNLIHTFNPHIRCVYVVP